MRWQMSQFVQSIWFRETLIAYAHVSRSLLRMLPEMENCSIIPKLLFYASLSRFIVREFPWNIFSSSKINNIDWRWRCCCRLHGFVCFLIGFLDVMRFRYSRLWWKRMVLSKHESKLWIERSTYQSCLFWSCSGNWFTMWMRRSI